MGLIERTEIVGVACDVRDCTGRRHAPRPLPVFSREMTRFQIDVLLSGWVRRGGRSVRWYCPDHAHMGTRCRRGCNGERTRYSRCPNHGGGTIWTAANAEELAR